MASESSKLDNSYTTHLAPDRTSRLRPLPDHGRPEPPFVSTTKPSVVAGANHIDYYDLSAGRSCPQDDHPSDAGRNIRRLLLAIFICGSFMVAEIIGGIVANSLSVLTDAAHLLSDIAGFLISLFAITWSTKPATSRMSFGYHRAEILGALLSIAMVWAMTAVLIIEAIDRIRHPSDVDGKIMAIVAALGLVVNVIMGVSLHSFGHGHGHSHSHGHTHRPQVRSYHTTSDSSSLDDCSSAVGIDLMSANDMIGDSGSPETSANGGVIPLLNSLPTEPTLPARASLPPHHQRRRPRENLNIRAAFIHVLGDLVQSIGVLIAALLIWYEPSWRLADPICTFLFSILVFASTVVLAREVVIILMEGTPSDIDPCAVRTDLLAIPGVLRVHDLHIWSISAGKMAVTVHIVVDSRFPDRSILRRCQDVICIQHHIHHSTIQIETDLDLTAHCRPALCSGSDPDLSLARA